MSFWEELILYAPIELACVIIGKILLGISRKLGSGVENAGAFDPSLNRKSALFIFACYFANAFSFWQFVIPVLFIVSGMKRIYSIVFVVGFVLFFLYETITFFSSLQMSCEAACVRKSTVVLLSIFHVLFQFAFSSLPIAVLSMHYGFGTQAIRTVAVISFSVILAVSFLIAFVNFKKR